MTLEIDLLPIFYWWGNKVSLALTVTKWQSWEFKPRSVLSAVLCLDANQWSFQKIKYLIRLVSSAKFILSMQHLGNSNIYSQTLLSMLNSFIQILTIAEATIWYKAHFSSEETSSQLIYPNSHRKSCQAKFRTWATLLPRMTLPHANSHEISQLLVEIWAKHGKYEFTCTLKIEYLKLTLVRKVGISNFQYITFRFCAMCMTHQVYSIMRWNKQKLIFFMLIYLNPCNHWSIRHKRTSI